MSTPADASQTLFYIFNEIITTEYVLGSLIFHQPFPI